jgi:thiol-disulfide isomerase/thioredoxin
MKTIALTLTAGLCLNLAVAAADPKPAPESPSAAAHGDDLSKFKTADDLWKHIEELRKEPDVQPKSQDELISIAKDWFGNQRAAASEFVKDYPADPRRYSAKLMALQADLQLSQLPGAAPQTESTREDLMKQADTILNAADAPEDAKGEAAFLRIMVAAGGINETKTAMIAAFFKDSGDFLAKYGQHRLAPEMRQTRFQLASEVESPESEAVLKSFAEDKDPQVAAAAKLTLAKREKMKELKTKPVDIKFTAIDGHEVDLANLRGKVVLVDFWASWCGPCMAEAPNVVATYEKLHAKGFEIVGISLDQEKPAMEAAMKEKGMTWPQYFDGKGWENEISSQFGIQSIPAAWLLDKKGMLRESGLRGEELPAGVEKLLAE